MELNEIFKNKFELPKDNFSNSTDLNEIKIGFSVYRDQKNLKREGFKSLFHVYIKNEEFEKTGDLKPIIITAVYGKLSEQGLITYSDDFSIDGKWPVELISKNEFFYNIRTQDLLYKNEPISGFEILKKINEEHIKTTKLVKGFWLRFKLSFFRKIFSNFIKILFYLFTSVQYLFTGVKIEFYSRLKNSISPVNEPGKFIKIFDYRVEIWIAVIYAIFHLTIYTFFSVFNYRPNFIITLLKNPFLITMYVIISLGLFDAILTKIPKRYFTKKILTFLQEKYFEAISKNIQI